MADSKPTDERPLGEKPLKLRARDCADMDVVAALLQDALVPLGDMTFLAREKRFVMVANRFRWHGDPTEDGLPSSPAPQAAGDDVAFAESEGNAPPFERVNSGLCFDKVLRVRYRGLSPGTKDEILNLLTIDSRPDAITLIFAGDAAIRLEVEAIRCHLEDIGHPWPTRWRPQHNWEPGKAASDAN